MANYGKGREAYPVWTDSEIECLRSLFPRTQWPELLKVFPTHTRGAIWQMGKKVLGLRREINKRDDWTPFELSELRRLYPAADDDVIQAAFPNRTWIAVQRMASALSILRPKLASRKNKRFVHPLFKELRSEREKQKLTRRALAKMVGYHENQIHMWELGKTKPDFIAVFDWAKALGFDLTLNRKATKESLDAIVVPWPERSAMMARR